MFPECVLSDIFRCVVIFDSAMYLHVCLLRIVSFVFLLYFARAWLVCAVCRGGFGSFLLIFRWYLFVCHMFLDLLIIASYRYLPCLFLAQYSRFHGGGRVDSILIIALYVVDVVVGQCCYTVGDRMDIVLVRVMVGCILSVVLRCDVWRFVLFPPFLRTSGLRSSIRVLFLGSLRVRLFPDGVAVRLVFGGFSVRSFCLCGFRIDV